MNAILCPQFEVLLVQQGDGPLPPGAMEHMDACHSCRILWVDLETIRKAGRELGAEEPAPAPQLWHSLRAQLEAEGLIRDNVPPGWFAGWFTSAPRFALAGAYLALLLLAGGGLVNFQADRSRTANSQPGRQLLAAETVSLSTGVAEALDGDMKRVMASLPERNSLLATSLQQNLGIVDNLIGLCEKSVREKPNDPVAREYLYGAYQQKAVLLSTALDRSTSEEQ